MLLPLAKPSRALATRAMSFRSCGKRAGAHVVGACADLQR
jgi:hypothetical protein